jgi:hypothetical protein
MRYGTSQTSQTSQTSVAKAKVPPNKHVVTHLRCSCSCCADDASAFAKDILSEVEQINVHLRSNGEKLDEILSKLERELERERGHNSGRACICICICICPSAFAEQMSLHVASLHCVSRSCSCSDVTACMLHFAFCMWHASRHLLSRCHHVSLHAQLVFSVTACMLHFARGMRRTSRHLLGCHCMHSWCSDVTACDCM